MELPRVSFVICTLNCKDFTERCLRSIRAQDYPQENVEIIVVDSYSTDGTIEVARSYGARVILTKIRGYMEGKGMPKAMGCDNARGDIVITIDSDNKLVEKDWIRRMIYPLMHDSRVTYAICRMAVVKSDPLVNQYLSYVGTDPFAIYGSLDPQISLKNVTLEDRGQYFVYTNTTRDFLVTGGYYLAFRKKDLKRIGGYSRDVDVAYTFAGEAGGARVAIVKNAHLHHLITTDTRDFLKKKVKWGSYYFKNPGLERKFNWNKGTLGRFGRVNFYYQVIKNLMFFPGVITSIVMAAHYKDKAWLMHGPLLFGTTAAYIIAYAKTRFSTHM